MSESLKGRSTASGYPIMDFLLPAICVLLFCTSQFRHLQNDLWVDELYTLEHFALKPAMYAVTHYQVHILFSLLEHFWLAISGLNDLQQALGHPFLLRCLPLLLSALTVLYVYRSGRLVQGKWAGFLAAIILITTIPFYNFAVQLRGYSLSMMLTAMLVYHCLKLFLSTRKSHVIIVILSAALLYSLPSDLYLLGAAIIIACAGFLLAGKRKNAQSFLWLRLSLSLIAGTIIGALCYLPILHSMLADSHLKSSRGINVTLLLHTVPVIFYHLLSARWIVLVACLAGTARVYFVNKNLLQIIAALSGLLILPFLLCALRNDEAPYRVFVIVIPPAAIIAGVCCVYIWSAGAKYFMPFIALLSCYCLGVFCLQIRKVNDVLYDALLTGKYWQDLYFQYYQAGYHPQENVAYFYQHHPAAKMILMHDAEPYELYAYLAPYQISLTRPDDFVSDVNAQDSAFVVTRYPLLLQQDLDQKTRQHWTVTQLRPEISYHNFMLVIRDKKAP